MFLDLVQQNNVYTCMVVNVTFQIKLFKNHYLKNYGYKSNIVTKVSLSFVNQCITDVEAHEKNYILLCKC